MALTSKSSPGTNLCPSTCVVASWPSPSLTSAVQCQPIGRACVCLPVEEGGWEAKEGREANPQAPALSRNTWVSLVKAEAENVGKLGNLSHVFGHSHPLLPSRSKRPKREKLERGHGKNILLSWELKWVWWKEDGYCGGRIHGTQNPQILPQDFVKRYAWLHDVIAQETPEPRLNSCAVMLCCHQLSQRHPSWLFPSPDSPPISRHQPLCQSTHWQAIIPVA